MQMNKVNFFGVFTLLLTLAILNFGYEWANDRNYCTALEHTYFQMLALLPAWWVWREPHDNV